MTERSKNLDKIMDISSFTSSRGFIVSSSDEEDNAKEINKSSTAVGSRLQNLFGTAPAPKQTPEAQQNGKKGPIFAESAILFTDGSSSGQMVGLAIIKRSDQFFLLVYNANKQVIANFPLAIGTLSLSVQFGEGSYLSLSSNSVSLSLFFEDSKKNQLLLLASILMLLCDIERCDIFQGEGEPATAGCHILVEEHFISLDDDSLKATERANLKWKLGSNSKSYLESIAGLGKRGIRIVKSSNGIVVVLTLKKIKFGHQETKIESIASESETSSQTPVEQPLAAEFSDVEGEIASITKTSDVLFRIDKVGLPIMPIVNFPKKEEEPQEDEVFPETSSPPKIRQDSIETPVLREYSTFHKVIGTEMDRLEVRLEASVQRMIDRAVEPLRDEIQELLRSQKRILLELEKLKS